MNLLNMKTFNCSNKLLLCHFRRSMKMLVKAQFRKASWNFLQLLIFSTEAFVSIWFLHKKKTPTQTSCLRFSILKLNVHFYDFSLFQLPGSAVRDQRLLHNRRRSYSPAGNDCRQLHEVYQGRNNRRSPRQSRRSAASYARPHGGLHQIVLRAFHSCCELKEAFSYLLSYLS